MLRRTLTLIMKELITVLRDKQSRLVIVVPVLMQVLLFPFAATLEVTNAPLGIYSEDNGQASVEITQRLAKAKAFSRVHLFPDSRSADQAMDKERILLLARFPADFSRNLAAGERTALQVILDGRHSNSAQIAANYIQKIVLEYQGELAAARGEKFVNTELEIRNWYNVNLDYKWFVLPSLIALITTVGVLILTSLSVAREREHGTLEQLLVSPLTTGQIFVGKAIPALIVASFQGTVILLFGVFVYRIPFSGSLLLFYGCMLVYGLSLVGFGLFITALCSTQQQSFIGVFLFMVPAVLLSGYIAPVENMPQWLQHASMINPIRHFTEITKQLYLKDAGLDVVWQSLWPMFVIFLGTGSISYLIFRRNVS